MKTETQCPEIVCDHSIAERPRYYARQLITDETLRLEQKYFIDRMRRHNRLLHGWGVVCGAQICLSPACKTNGAGNKPWEVVVKPGYILGPYGDEIIIDCERVVDLRTRGVSGVTGEPCVEPVDPWCSDVYVPRNSQKPLFVAVKYKECQTRPVRVQPDGCGCDDTQCEYSRWRDGYEIRVLTCCPDDLPELHSRHQKEVVDLLMPVIKRGVRPEGPPQICPKCPTEPWVVLGSVTVDDNGTITRIDNCDCRRIIYSLANRLVPCESVVPTVKSIDPPKLAAGTTDWPVVVIGENFEPGMLVDLGPGVTVTYPDSATKQTPNNFKVKVTVDDAAPTTDRYVTLVNPDCAMARSDVKFHVDNAATHAVTGPNAMPSRAATGAFVPARPRRGAPRTRQPKEKK